MGNIINDITKLIEESRDISSGMSKRKWGYSIGGVALGIGAALANRFFFDGPTSGIPAIGAIGGFFTGQIQAYNFLKEKVFGNKIEDVKKIDQQLILLFQSVGADTKDIAVGVPSCANNAENMEDKDIIKGFKSCYIDVIKNAIKTLKTEYKGEYPEDKLREVEKLIKGL
jgi:hypothetical protein